DGLGVSPVLGQTAVPVKTPVHYLYPFANPDENVKLFKHVVTRLALAVTGKCEKIKECKEGGIIIDAPGTLNQPKGGYEALMHVVSEFSINVIFTLKSERLLNDLTRRFANPKNPDDAITVLMVPTASGAIDRDASFMKTLRSKQVKSYFHGTSRLTLYPHTQTVSFSDLAIYKIIDAESFPSFLPGADDDEEAGPATTQIYERATPTLAMQHALLAVMHCRFNESQETIRDTAVKGFVYVSEVNETKKVVRMLVPQASEWSGRALVWGAWPEVVEV
ncbi:Cleavage polyadenylation factor subunit clp1, partial [Elasticomyces elasticus]